MNNKKKIMVVFGTRPEAIKMAPVILELNKHPNYFETQIVVTGQHRQMLDQILDAFGIAAHHDINLMTANQSLGHILTMANLGVEEALERMTPDLMLVQGDTTTAMAAALAAYHRQIKLGHVEAGLRSFDKYNPFPEEINRMVIDSIADYCFAPTMLSRENLRKTGKSENKIFVTGNTVVDALLQISSQEYPFENQQLNAVDFKGRKVILLTTHRRENYMTGEMSGIMESLNTLIKNNQNIEVVFPLHLNPNVRTIVHEQLQKSNRVHVLEPLSYKDLIKVMRQSYLIMTDSGGIQEEGPTFGKPVLVLRKVTERPEGIDAGVAKLVGTDAQTIIAEVELLLEETNYLKMAKAANPYGDGTAAQKIVSIVKERI